jgi:hypothetical protein
MPSWLAPPRFSSGRTRASDPIRAPSGSPSGRSSTARLTVWDAFALSAFTADPDEGARPSEATTVRIAYDDQALCASSFVPKTVPARRYRRQPDPARRDVGSDAIIIDLDTRGSHTGAFISR